MALEIYPSSAGTSGESLPVRARLALVHAITANKATLADNYKVVKLESHKGPHLNLTTGAQHPVLKTASNNTFLDFGAGAGMSTDPLNLAGDLTFMFIVDLQLVSAGQSQMSWNVGSRKMSCQLMTSASGGLTIVFGTGTSNRWTKDSTALRSNRISNILVEKNGISVTVYINGVSEGTQRVVAADASQWVASATASSQYSSSQYSAGQLAGAPNAGYIPGNRQGFNNKCWAPSTGARGQVHTLTLTYTHAVSVEAIEVLETYHVGSISKIEALPEGQTSYTTIYTKSGSTQTGGLMTGVVNLKVSNAIITLTEPTDFLTKTIRIFTGSSTATNPQIDAVRLKGLAGESSAKMFLGHEGTSEVNLAAFHFYALFVYNRVLTSQEKHKLLIYAKSKYTTPAVTASFDHSTLATKAMLKDKIIQIENEYVQKENAGDSSSYIIRVSDGKKNQTGAWANRAVLAYT